MRCFEYTHNVSGSRLKSLFEDHADWEDALREISVEGTVIEVALPSVEIPIDTKAKEHAAFLASLTPKMFSDLQADLAATKARLAKLETDSAKDSA